MILTPGAVHPPELVPGLERLVEVVEPGRQPAATCASVGAGGLRPSCPAMSCAVAAAGAARSSPASATVGINTAAAATTSPARRASASFSRCIFAICLGLPFPDETASTTRRGRSSASCATRAASCLDAASKTKKQISSSGTWIVRSKRTPVPFLRQLLGGRARPPLARGRLSLRLRAGGRSRRGSSAHRRG